jgi:histone H3/H4
MIPISSVDRIMREALFEGCELPTSSKAFMQACLSKFITHLTMVRPMCIIRLVCAYVLAPPLGFPATHPCRHPWLASLVQGALIKCERENRKSITADDLVWTLKLSSEFNHYAPLARAYTQRHRAIEATTRLSKRQGLTLCPHARLLLLLRLGVSAVSLTRARDDAGDQSLNFNQVLPIFATTTRLTSGSAMPEHLQTSKQIVVI